MKKLLVLFLFTLFSLTSAQSFNIEHNEIIDSNIVLKPEFQHKAINQVVTQILSRYHYKKIAINDSLSSIIFDNYIKSYDNGRYYFLKADIDEFEKYRFEIDNNLYSGKLDPAFDIYNRYKKRLDERMDYVQKALENEFDYSKDEYYVPDRKQMEWALSSAELDDIWRKRLKSDALNKKLSKDDWETIQKALKRRYQNYHKLILQYQPEDVFQLYLNAFAEAVDPHTNYLSPKNSEQFDISMNLSLEGIGASLRLIDDYTTIAEIIPGGPAFKSKDLHPDDRIVAVSQGDTTEFVDVIGWRIDDTVQQIRGKKGTVVRLRVLRADKSISEATDIVRLVRDKVKLEERAASKEVIQIDEDGVNFKLGIIKIPTFYLDFAAKSKGDIDYRSTTRDIKKLLTELKEEKVDGVIIDLRNNGGGSLDEAIQMTGLFVDEGPIVQIKSSDSKIEVGEDPDAGIFYDGPLAVMVNKYSASASEIFSAAIQDYGRGIIIGEQTFGKGTVQNLVDLKKFVPITDKEKIGKLKLTIAKFYRVNGNSTQHRGVIPDIKFPSALDPSEYGESSQPSALPYDNIKSSNFQKYGNLSEIIKMLMAKHSDRIKNNQEFKYLAEDISLYKENIKKKEFSLNEDIRKQEREKNEDRKKERENARNITVKDKEEVPIKDMKIDDPLLEESGHILADMIFEINSKVK
ncbi:MAG: carboxy terminal-processing peptidase [Melioribacteraceae bacterium]|nr:carboxy terminal-processing peptidase [Melioribacteraceae bacterium]